MNSVLTLAGFLQLVGLLALEALNAAPPQLTIEVKVAEITQDDNKALGFDWLSGSAFVDIDSNSPLRSFFEDALTNGVQSSGSTRFTNAPQQAVTGILTDPQYRVVLRALEQRQGVDLLSMPKVTTLSGRQAQIKIPEIKSAMTVLGYQTTTYSVEGKTKVVSNAHAKSFEVGPLVIVPSVPADSDTIRLSFTNSVKKFLGYELDPLGFPTSPKTPTPVFRSRQFLGSANVYDGQTIVLSGGSFTVLGEPPRAGESSRNESSKSMKKSLLIFVTLRLVDAAGNPLHDDEDLRKYSDKIPPEQPK